MRLGSLRPKGSVLRLSVPLLGFQGHGDKMTVISQSKGFGTSYQATRVALKISIVRLTLSLMFELTLISSINYDSVEATCYFAPAVWSCSTITKIMLLRSVTAGTLGTGSPGAFAVQRWIKERKVKHTWKKTRPCYPYKHPVIAARTSKHTRVPFDRSHLSQIAQRPCLKCTVLHPVYPRA